jgi:tetratricopeptide (TPR) repeat protein
MAIAIQLDPFSIIMNHNMGAAYYYQGDFEKAISWFQRVNDLDPSLMLASWGSTNMIQAYVLSGRTGDAAKELEKLERLPRKLRTLELMRAYVLAGMKRSEEARAVLRKVESEYVQQQVSPYQIALVRFALGDVDEGFRWLQVAYDTHDGGVIWINGDHELKDVRDDPRFIALRNAVGLPTLPSA